MPPPSGMPDLARSRGGSRVVCPARDFAVGGGGRAALFDDAPLAGDVVSVWWFAGF